MRQEIEIIPSYKIDKLKWDDCINNTTNGLIYATTDYLDNMTDNWHGIIVNDYNCVMPVPWRKKLGIRYSYDVAFVPQLGWFSKELFLTTDILTAKLFEFVKYGDYTFNYSNKIPAGNTLTKHHNYILDLSSGYEMLEKKFSSDVRTNIRNAHKNDFSYSVCEVTEPVDVFIKLYNQRLQHITDDDYKKFKSLTNTLQKKTKAFARKVLSSSGELLSTILIFKDDTRLYNIMNSTTAAGKKMDANYFLLTELWKEFEGQQLIFDFEGSDIPGVKKFYEKFGSINHPYSMLHFNHLPFPLNILKR